jgi:hypothetical protein
MHAMLRVPGYEAKGSGEAAKAFHSLISNKKKYFF